MSHKKYIRNLFIRVMCSIILFLLISIFINYSNQNLLFFKKHFYDKTLDFSKYSNVYQKYFGKPLPNTQPVAVNKEEITYSEVRNYKDGAEVSGISSVTPFKSGIVVFVGEKEGYGQTVIIQGMDGIDYWYGNLENISIKLYDYIESDTIIAGATDSKLFLVFMKNGEVLNFEEYI